MQRTYEVRVCTGAIGFEVCEASPRPTLTVQHCSGIEMVQPREHRHQPTFTTPHGPASSAFAAGDASDRGAGSGATSEQHHQLLAKSTFSVPTVLAMDGTHGLRIAHSEFPYVCLWDGSAKPGGPRSSVRVRTTCTRREIHSWCACMQAHRVARDISTFPPCLCLCHLL